MKYAYLLIFLIGLTLTSSTRKICNKKNTKIYETDEYDYTDLFQANTFIEHNKCLELGNPSKTKYMKILNDTNTKCIGYWCINGNFEWNKNKQCYEVEHIIDRHNTPYDKCNTNILGNVIMAYGSWNNQIGQLCWKDAKNEKIEIYGKDIFCKAVKNILDCSNCDAKIPNECVVSDTNNRTIQKQDVDEKVIYIMVIIGLCTFCLIMVIFVLVNSQNYIKSKIKGMCCYNKHQPPFELVDIN